MLSILFAMLAGICVTMQNSLNGLMSPILGAMGVSLAGFVIQSALMTACYLGKEHNLRFLRKVPFGFYAVGLFGTVIVGAMGVCVARMGSAVTQCCSVAGQILMSAVVDHFGLFGTKKNAFALRRLPGFLMILGGVLLMNLLGGGSAGRVPLAFLLLGMTLGSGAIVARTLNFRGAQYAGSSLGGGIVNSLGSAVCALVLYLAVSGFRPDVTVFTQVPPWLYLAGAFGAACNLCNLAAYKGGRIFYSTIFMLIGQVITGITMDLLVFHTLSPGRCVGIAVVLLGVLTDKVLTRK